MIHVADGWLGPLVAATEETNEVDEKCLEAVAAQVRHTSRYIKEYYMTYELGGVQQPSFPLVEDEVLQRVRELAASFPPQRTVSTES